MNDVEVRLLQIFSLYAVLGLRWNDHLWIRINESLDCIMIYMMNTS